MSNLFPQRNRGFRRGDLNLGDLVLVHDFMGLKVFLGLIMGINETEHYTMCTLLCQDGKTIEKYAQSLSLFRDPSSETRNEFRE